MIYSRLCCKGNATFSIQWNGLKIYTVFHNMKIAKTLNSAEGNNFFLLEASTSIYSKCHFKFSLIRNKTVYRFRHKLIFGDVMECITLITNPHLTILFSKYDDIYL